MPVLRNDKSGRKAALRAIRPDEILRSASSMWRFASTAWIIRGVEPRPGTWHPVGLAGNLRHRNASAVRSRSGHSSNRRGGVVESSGEGTVQVIGTAGAQVEGVTVRNQEECRHSIHFGLSASLFSNRR